MVAFGCASVGHYVKGWNNRQPFGDAHQLELITKNENLFLKRERGRERDTLQTLPYNTYHQKKKRCIRR